MKLVDMKLPKKTKSELAGTVQPSKVEQDRWPYGLKLSFESEQMDKLPQLEKMKIGESVSVSGTGEVTSIRMNERTGGKKEYSVEVQIQKIGVESGKSESMGQAIERHKKSLTMSINEG